MGPPLIQQRIAAGEPELLHRVVARMPAGDQQELVVGSACFVEDLPSRQELEALLAEVVLWDRSEDAENPAGALHSVMQRSVAAVSGARPMPVDVSVEYNGTAQTLSVLPSMTGLQLKSRVIADLGLDGGFQHYYLRLNDTPFGSRMPVTSHPDFAAGCNLVLEDIGDRPKASGHT